MKDITVTTGESSCGIQEIFDAAKRDFPGVDFSTLSIFVNTNEDVILTDDSSFSRRRVVRVEGYIVESEKGQFLTKTLVWYPHKDIVEAYVHTKASLRKLLSMSASWDKIPKTLYPATFEDGKVTITGAAHPIHLLP